MKGEASRQIRVFRQICFTRRLPFRAYTRTQRIQVVVVVGSLGRPVRKQVIKESLEHE
jgi:hypothetical protein